MGSQHLATYTTSWWLQASRSPKPWLDAGAFRTCVAAWRYYVGMVNSNRLVDTMNVNLARLPNMPQRTPVLRAVSSQISLDALIETPKVSMDDTASIPPPFTWGDFEARAGMGFWVDGLCIN